MVGRKRPRTNKNAFIACKRPRTDKLSYSESLEKTLQNLTELRNLKATINGKVVNDLDCVKKALEYGFGKQYLNSIFILLIRQFGKVDFHHIEAISKFMKNDVDALKVIQQLKLSCVDSKLFVVAYNKCKKKPEDMFCIKSFIKLHCPTLVKDSSDFFKECKTHNIREVCILLSFMEGFKLTFLEKYSLLITLKDAKDKRMFKVHYVDEIEKLSKHLMTVALSK